MASRKLITLNDVSVKYPGATVPVVNKMSFHVAKGERLLITGPSGCGKSTLAYVLNGTLPRSIEAELTGDVALGGQLVAEQSVKQIAEKVGILFQDPESQFCMQTVEEEVAFGLENLCIPTMEMEDRIEQSLVQVGLGTERKTQLHELSGGMKQRLGLACLLAMNPEVLILDEPTANLDPQGADELLRIVMQLAESSGKTLILIEHRLDRIVPHLDRVLLMNREGTLIADGSPRELFGHQQQLFKQEGAAIPAVCERAIAFEAKGFIWSPFPLTVAEGNEQLIMNDRQANRTRDLFSTDATGAEHRDVDHRQVSMAKVAPIMKVCDLAFRYEQKEVLRGVSFNLYPGAITVLLGMNGAGKSTLVQLLMKLLKPTSGTVRLYDTPLTMWRDRELYRKVGYVFQNPEHQFLRDSVEAELAFGFEWSGLPQDQWQHKVETQLEEFGLEHVRAQHPFQLSQGQKRRLSVATMLSHDQELLLFDEPTFGQDAHYTEALMTMMAELRDEGKALLMITHDVELVYRYADQALVLHEGTIAFDGDPNELFADFNLLKRCGLQKPLSKQLDTWLKQGTEVVFDA